jgi:hypothetical protein
VPEQDHLLTFAEVSVAFAGFSSLVALLGSRRGRSHPELDVARLLIMLEASLFVALMSVLPLLPNALGASEQLTWRVSAGLFLVIDGIASYVDARRWRVVWSHFEGADRTVFGIVAVLSVAGDLLVLAILIGIQPELAPGLYLGALVANLVLSGLLFIRFAGSTFGAASGRGEP